MHVDDFNWDYLQPVALGPLTEVWCWSSISRCILAKSGNYLMNRLPLQPTLELMSYYSQLIHSCQV